MPDRAAKRLMCCFQVYGQQNRLQKYCKFFYKQHTIDKFDAVIAQLDEHSERAWQLADRSDMPVRRRGTRSSFSQGLQRDSSGLASADSVEFEKAVRPGNCSTSHPSQCCASAAEFLSAALFLSTSDFCKCGTALVVSTHTHTHKDSCICSCLALSAVSLQQVPNLERCYCPAGRSSPLLNTTAESCSSD